ncbi:MAG: biotin/lipoyl-binding protein [Bacteroidales bacterium]|nr:biotin/lipoyl-binding protein [Bacteroidales bacterium]
MDNKRFHKILIANRGEIAVRIIKAIRKAGMKAVVVHSSADREMPYVRMADEAWPLTGDTLSDTYLHQQKIIDIALNSGSSAIHPGYGFLAENAEFARLCEENNIAFIGPSPELIDLMGNKSKARSTAEKFGVPVINGVTGSAKAILLQAEQLEYPVLIKPAAGGGGKGMHIVRDKNKLKEAMADASREAVNYFGSGELYVERYIEQARHIEVQVLADNHGNAVHLFERECTLQRRYQKIIEEAPSPSLSENTRKKITQSALELIKGIGYTNAGTIEFLMDENERFYFIEMNTRIQVEHPVTEMITGLDLVKEQISVAADSKLSFQQSDIKIKGHAIETRLYAEDPANDFLPSTGTIHKIETDLVSLRMDNGYNEGNYISPYYDPMICKLVSHGSDRKEAVRQMVSGLQNFHVSGISTNREFLVSLLLSPDFRENRISTKYIDNHLQQILDQLEKDKNHIGTGNVLSILSLVALHHQYPAERQLSVWDEIGHWRQTPSIQFFFNNENHRITYRVLKRKKAFEVNINGTVYKAEILDNTNNCFRILIGDKQYRCWADVNGPDILLDVEQFSFRAIRRDIPDDRQKRSVKSADTGIDTNEVTAPLNGKIVKINVKKGDTVKNGDTLLVIESMKMENRINAPRDAEIKDIPVTIGNLVELNSILITLK